MPYLPTPQAYLEQSALLLEAYPDTRITTKYSFPSHKPKPSSTTDAAPDSQSQPQTSNPTSTSTPVATLTLKTYNPSAGLCLKYRTNKAAEVGRLITSLGKLAGGADVASLGLGAAAAAPVADVEMADATEEGTATPTTAAAAAGGAAKTESNSKGGKAKKKGGKGKR